MTEYYSIVNDWEDEDERIYYRDEAQARRGHNFLVTQLGSIAAGSVVNRVRLYFGDQLVEDI